MEKFLIRGKQDISLFELWGGLGNHYQALISLGYIINPDKHYLYYEDDFNLDAYKAVHGSKVMPKRLINSKKTDLSNISLARYSTDGVLLWKRFDVMSIGNSLEFYKKDNCSQILRIIKECEVKFLIFESRHFQKNESKKVETVKSFFKELSNIGYIIKEINLDNYEYFSLLKQNRPYFICYLPKFVFFKQDYLDKKTERHYFFGKKLYLNNTEKLPFLVLDKSRTCFLRIYKVKPFINFQTVKEHKSHFTYTPLDKYELPIIFRPKGTHSFQINKTDSYINEVKKIYDADKEEFKYIRPTIGRYKNYKINARLLFVVQVPLRELLLQYGFFSEAAYIQKLGQYDHLNEYIKNEENEFKIIKSLAGSPSVNVLKYIYASMFIYINKREVSYAKEHRE